MTTATEPQTLSLGERIQWARKEAGYSSQIAFAAALGTSQRHVSRWETNRHDPGPSYVKRIAELTGQPEELFADDDPEEPV